MRRRSVNGPSFQDKIFQSKREFLTAAIPRPVTEAQPYLRQGTVEICERAASTNNDQIVNPVIQNVYPTACRKYSHPSRHDPFSVPGLGDPNATTPFASNIFFARNKW